jgi:hypothetical protein
MQICINIIKHNTYCPHQNQVVGNGKTFHLHLLCFTVNGLSQSIQSNKRCKKNLQKYITTVLIDPMSSVRQILRSGQQIHDCGRKNLP